MKYQVNYEIDLIRIGNREAIAKSDLPAKRKKSLLTG